MPLTNRLGSKLGTLTIASTWPLRGSIATAAPGRPSKASIGGLLQAFVDGQVQVLAGLGGDLLQHAQRPLVGIDLDHFVAGRAVQHVLVVPFQPGPADVGGALVAIGIELCLFLGVDAPDIAHHVRELGTIGIVAGEVGHHVDAREIATG